MSLKNIILQINNASETVQTVRLPGAKGALEPVARACASRRWAT